MYHRDSLLSKSLSWLLRHGACQEGFELSPEGYLEVEKILQHPIYKDKCHLSDIETIVANDPKQRFKLQYNPTFGYLEIKAHQGHSIRTVTEGLTPITTPKYETVVHGTHFKYWPSIRRDGLNRMTRNHIHFAKRTSQANYISGLRGNAEVLIYVDLKKALDEGLKFYESDNGVILTSGNEQGFLEPQYFLKVLCAKTGTLLFP